MQSLTVMITPAEKGGYSAHIIDAEILNSRVATNTTPVLSVSELVDIVVWLEGELEALGGQDAPRARDIARNGQSAGSSTQRMAARHAPQLPDDPVIRKGIFGIARTAG